MRGWSLGQFFWSVGHLPALIRFCQWLTKENPLEFSQTTFSHYVAQLMREAGLAKEKADLCVDEIQVRSLAKKTIRTECLLATKQALEASHLSLVVPLHYDLSWPPQPGGRINPPPIQKTIEAQEKMVCTSVSGMALCVWRLQPSGMNLACP